MSAEPATVTHPLTQVHHHYHGGNRHLQNGHPLHRQMTHPLGCVTLPLVSFGAFLLIPGCVLIGLGYSDRGDFFNKHSSGERIAGPIVLVIGTCMLVSGIVLCVHIRRQLRRNPDRYPQRGGQFGLNQPQPIVTENGVGVFYTQTGIPAPTEVHSGGHPSQSNDIEEPSGHTYPPPVGHGNPAYLTQYQPCISGYPLTENPGHPPSREPVQPPSPGSRDYDPPPKYPG